jgi:hypothetical protein
MPLATSPQWLSLEKRRNALLSALAVLLARRRTFPHRFLGRRRVLTWEVGTCYRIQNVECPLPALNNIAQSACPSGRHRM